MQRATLLFGSIEVPGMVTKIKNPVAVAMTAIQYAIQLGHKVDPFATLEPLGSIYYVYVDPMVVPGTTLPVTAIGEYEEDTGAPKITVTDTKCIEEIGTKLLELGIPPIGIEKMQFFFIPPVTEITNTVAVCKL